MPSEKTVRVKLTGDISDFNRAMLAAAAGTKGFAKELDTSNDRMSLLVQSSLALGPALVPVGAALVPVISGLSNQLAIATAGAGVAILAFSGVGDALKATNDYAIEPTDANLQKMRQSLSELGPAGREFVEFLQEARPQLQGLQDAAQAGLFPGAEAGIRDLLTVLPQAERIIGKIADGMGTLLAEAGDNLTDPRWIEFFDFIETEARQTLLDFGRSMGNLTEGFANLWMAFDPLSQDFSASFLQMSRDFAAWTDQLGETRGFQEFVDYIRSNGPEAWDTLGALGTALVELVEAAAPVGSAALPIIEKMADAFSAIAETDVGPVLIGAAAGISAVSRAVALFNTAQGSKLAGLLGKTTYGGIAKSAKDLPAASRAYLDFGAALDTAGPKVGKFATTSQRLGASLAGNGKLIAGAGGLAFVMSDLDDQMGLSNAAMGALIGTMFGPWGTAIGGGIGAAKDFAAANDDVWKSIDRANEALKQGPNNIPQQSEAVKAAKDDLQALKKEIDGTDSSFLTRFLPGADDGARLKNSIEGVFGASDLEEAAAAAEALNGPLEANTRAAQDLKFEEAGLGEAMDGASDSTREQTDSILDNIAAKNAAADRALIAANAELAYEDAIDKAAKAAKEGKDTTDKGTEAGRENLTLLYGLAGAWNNLTVEQQSAKGASERARESFIDAATGMGMGRAAAEKYADELLDIPPKVETVVNLRDKQAKEGLAAVRAALEGIEGNWFANIFQTTTKRTVSGDDAGNNARAPKKKASGGYVTGPGTTTSDSIPALLSNREYVVKASSVEKYGVGMFDALNAGRYAGGGLVGASRMPATYAPQSAATPLVARLADPTVSVSKDGLVRLVDDRVLLSAAASENYAGAKTRRRT